jgi:hypothetical protein
VRQAVGYIAGFLQGCPLEELFMARRTYAEHSTYINYGPVRRRSKSTMEGGEVHVHPRHRSSVRGQTAAQTLALAVALALALTY